jgi:hypothetical protein
MRPYPRFLHRQLVIVTLAIPLVLTSVAVHAQEPTAEPSASPFDVDRAAAVSADTTDTSTRDDVRARYGPPEAFAILYFDEPGPDGTSTTTSTEQWSYFGEGVEFTFAGDEVVAAEVIGVVDGADAEPVPYDPDDFHAYMSLDEVVAAAGVEEYIGGPVEELVEGGELYFADRLSWGLQDGELRYIEALALEAGPTAGDPE